MKFASYTEDTIWSVEETQEEARTEGLATMDDLEVADDLRATLKVAPIADALVQALAEVEDTGEEVLFDLIDGTLETLGRRAIWFAERSKLRASSCSRPTRAKACCCSTIGSICRQSARCLPAPCRQHSSALPSEFPAAVLTKVH